MIVPICSVHCQWKGFGTWAQHHGDVFDLIKSGLGEETARRQVITIKWKQRMPCRGKNEAILPMIDLLSFLVDGFGGSQDRKAWDGDFVDVTEEPTLLSLTCVWCEKDLAHHNELLIDFDSELRREVHKAKYWRRDRSKYGIGRYVSDLGDEEVHCVTAVSLLSQRCELQSELRTLEKSTDAWYAAALISGRSQKVGARTCTGADLSPKQSDVTGTSE